MNTTLAVPNNNQFETSEYFQALLDEYGFTLEEVLGDNEDENK